MLPFQRTVRRTAILLLPALCLFLSGFLCPGFAQTKAGQAKERVEKILIEAWQQTYDAQTDTASRGILVNAPVSGKSNKRGRHLLSFAAFNDMKALALWGLAHGADINKGDKDNATLLRMSAANYLQDWVEFALSRGADPNIEAGDGNETLLEFMFNWGWPAAGIAMAIENGAKARNSRALRTAGKYLHRHFQPGRADRLIATLGTPLKEPVKRAVKGAQTDTQMIAIADKALLGALASGRLTPGDIRAFRSREKNFAGFLTFNGFSETLHYVLNTVFDSEEAGRIVSTRDENGNDLLLAAIKSLDAEVVRTVLETGYADANAMVPDRAGYASRGDRPLHVAVKWKVRPEIFQLLLQAGANPALNNAAGRTPALIAKWWNAPAETLQLLESTGG